MKKPPKKKPNKLQQLLNESEAPPPPRVVQPAVKRDPDAIAANKRMLWASMRKNPALAELAKNDFVFRRLVNEVVTHFEVSEISLVAEN